MQPEYIIRPARHEDFESVRRVLEASGLPVEGVEERLVQGYCVAESGGETIGVGGIEVYGRHGLLRSVAVSPAWRKKGAGSRVVEDRVAWAASRGLAAIFLLTVDAGPFFARRGFQGIDRLEVPPEVQASWEFTSGCCRCAVAMKRGL
jgi:amino-acid N-acetyltransferase